MRNFYDRPEWHQIRYRILRKYGTRCMVCNRGREDGAIIQVDHIRPVSLFPELSLNEDNLQVLCRECNMGKSNLFDDDHRPKHVMNAIRPGRRYKFGDKPWREIHPDKRRVVALAKLTQKIKIKMIKSEAENDQLMEVKLMRQYLDVQRLLKVHGLKIFSESV